MLDRYPRHLSGGQRQHVAMGRAIVRDPKVFLFDEPLSNLDAKLRVQMRAEIKVLHQRLRAMTVYVTHDQIEAMTMADRRPHRRAERRGDPAGRAPLLDLYDDPDNGFVADFIGSPSMNFVPGRYERTPHDGAPASVRAGDLRIPAPAVEAAEGQVVLFGVRPEHLCIAADDDTEAVPFAIEVVEPTGASTELFGSIGRRRCCVMLNERVSLRAQTVVLFRAMRGRAMIFNSESGRRLR